MNPNYKHSKPLSSRKLKWGWGCFLFGLLISEFFFLKAKPWRAKQNAEARRWHVKYAWIRHVCRNITGYCLDLPSGNQIWRAGKWTIEISDDYQRVNVYTRDLNVYTRGKTVFFPDECPINIIILSCGLPILISRELRGGLFLKSDL